MSHLSSWPSGKLPFDCQKIAKNLTFKKKKWQFLSICLKNVKFLAIFWQSKGNFPEGQFHTMETFCIHLQFNNLFSSRFYYLHSDLYYNAFFFSYTCVFYPSLFLFILKFFHPKLSIPVPFWHNHFLFIKPKLDLNMSQLSWYTKISILFNFSLNNFAQNNQIIIINKILK